MHKKSTVLSAAIFGIIAIISAVLLFSKIANSPHAAAIISTTTDTKNQTSLNMSPVHIHDNYVSFDYPKVLTSAKTSLVSGEVDAYRFTHRDIATWDMTIEVMPNSNGSLESNSAYAIRKENPSEYQESNYTDKGQNVDVMSDITYGGFSKVAFLQHGPYLATVSLYGDDTNGENALTQTFNMVINSWHWQR